ncbi:energy transducer TonB [Pseudomonas sp. LJDD11]|uniref:energy transducer TonB n=1 Tax=Pseudomonas sp. LJDD11 TaxID=2931984 RepID=UPI00211C319C|nr:energy transducer TonB [Pseudomonas sp. LJDD11]MCQ9423314.1 energy transducer TonB [Pseudomonas sp. LJDD11]
MGNVQTAASAHEVPWRQAPSGELVDLGRPYRGPLALSRLHSTPKRVLGRREGILLGAFALVLHGAVIYWVSQTPTPALPVVPPEIPPMTIEFSAPTPPLVEPPPPEPIPEPVVQEPPPPVEDELAVKPPPPKPKPKPVVKPAPKPVPKPVEQPPAPTPPPPQPVAAPAPPAPPAPAPVTPPSASAGYLRNPAPEYPSLAMRRGWEGTVLLRVHVLASGRPGDIQIQKSSGRDQLDEAAVTAVKRWSFVPGKQGDKPVDGWVSVPIDFKLK